MKQDTHEYNIKLTRDEVKFWDEIVVAYMKNNRSALCIDAAEFADKVILQRRKRFEEKSNEGPYR